MTSVVVTLLAERPAAELEKMQAKARGEVARLEAALQRRRVETEQIDEALQIQARREGRAASSGQGKTRSRVIKALEELGRPASPAEIIEKLDADGGSPSRGSIYNTLGRLVGDDLIRKLDDGRYATLKVAGNPFMSAAADPVPDDDSNEEPEDWAAWDEVDSNESTSVNSGSV